VPAAAVTPDAVAPFASWSAEAPVGFAETHCAVVFFVGNRAYKLKKPVDLGFLDFSTRPARERVCHREVELNQRLSPDVYLGVADVLGPNGQPCDHLVVMRRMPAHRRLATLLDQGQECADCLRAVARQVAALHAAAPTSADRPEIGEVATCDAVTDNWTDNFDALQPFVGQVLNPDEFTRVQQLANRYLAGRRELFDRRIATGQVRDGHGDLLAEDIFCLDDGPRILDCLEFADRYRYGDVLLDAAFLAMDLERLGHADAAERFFGWYLEFSGEHHPTTLAHHYIAYRAHVRAKVACLRHAQTGDGEAAEQARQLHALALDHLRQGRVTLLLVGGLPGTGKSTVAAGLADSYGWALLRSDELRKDLAELGHTVNAHTDVDAGLYRPEQVTRVYRELLARAEKLLQHGVPVVLDASWTAAADRHAAVELAATTCSDLVQLRCETTLDVARARLALRPSGTDPSDATPEVLAAMAARAEPWPQAATLHTGHPIDQVLACARQAVATQLEDHKMPATDPPEA
jgi:aminoglycoside phosphotransferase family enzyme/predicted kinase